MNRRHILRSPSSPRRPRRLAYPVPWHVDRSAAPLYRLVNTSRHELRGVTLSIAGASTLRITAPASLRPGESLRAAVTGRSPERDSVLVVRWFRRDGREYLWQMSF